MSATVTLIGLLDDGWAGLSETARHSLNKADLVIGCLLYTPQSGGAKSQLAG